MSSISLPKPLRLVALQRREPSGREITATSRASVRVQDRSTTENATISPSLFWKIIIAVTIVVLAGNVIGMAVFSSNWLTAYWDALDHWCAGGYCR